MPNPLEGLKPEILWNYFAEIAKIPRCSKNEAAITKYVYQTARHLGLKAKTDKAGNVVVRKPSSPGKEHVRSVCLQGHLDMVCEKNADKAHDFLKDPIELVRRGDCVMANGTTLGADNGIAIATNLAIMAEKSLEHGPLEFLFTVDEETGLTGAASLEPGFLKSRILLNLDSEEEGFLFVGCAGGKDTEGRWTAAFGPAPANHVPVEIRVKGLKGGHSGLEIDKGRGNAIKILNRLLWRLSELGARIASLNGGNKHNAIPREAFAVLFVPRKALDDVAAAVRQFEGMVQAEVAAAEPELAVGMEILPRLRRGTVIGKALQRRLLQTVTALPHGVMKMSAEISGLVETSTNVAVMRTTRKEISLATSQRSSVASEIAEIADMVGTIFEMGGARVRVGTGYPGWKPNLTSEILQVAKSTYLALFGTEPEVHAVHAGLECGIIGEKSPGMDMVSFGPTIVGVHSPDEKIYIDSVEKFWTYLLAILKNIP